MLILSKFIRIFAPVLKIGCFCICNIKADEVSHMNILSVFTQIINIIVESKKETMCGRFPNKRCSSRNG